MPDSVALPQLTWRVVWFSLLAAAFSLVGGSLSLYDHHGASGIGTAGIIVGGAAFQVANARRVFLRGCPSEVRSWMRPVTAGLCVLALVCFAVAGWVTIHH